MNSSLEKLKEKYSTNHGVESLFAFRDAFKRYTVSRQQSLIDLTVVATNLSPQIFFDDKNIDPLVEKAIRETNPNFDPSFLFNFSDDELTGIVNSAKGKYFEYLVTEKLNSGETVGNLYLPDGYQAIMAESLTQPGWDIKIIDDNGNTADYLQLKATNSLAYINETLERYPDIEILSTHEVATRADGIVFDSGISEEDLRESVLESIDELDPSLMDNFLTAFNPLMPLVYIMASEGYRLSVGKDSVGEALGSTQFRIERTLVASGVGALIYAIGGGWLALPASFIGGELYNQYKESSLDSYSFEKSTARLKTYRLYQQQKIIDGGNYGFVV